MADAKPDPFILEEIEFEVGGQKFLIKALPLKQFKEALTLVRAGMSQVQTAAQQDDLGIINAVPEIVLEKFTKLFPLVLGKPELTEEWILEHVSVPLARKILEAAARINGVGDFLARRPAARA